MSKANEVSSNELLAVADAMSKAISEWFDEAEDNWDLEMDRARGWYEEVKAKQQPERRT